jgi:hypothetical protein
MYWSLYDLRARTQYAALIAVSDMKFASHDMTLKTGNRPVIIVKYATMTIPTKVTLAKSFENLYHDVCSYCDPVTMDRFSGLQISSSFEA